MATTAQSIAAQPTRLAPDEFSPATDLLAPALDQEGAGGPQVALEGARSGLRVAFWTNRESCVVCGARAGADGVCRGGRAVLYEQVQ